MVLAVLENEVVRSEITQMEWDENVDCSYTDGDCYYTGWSYMLADDCINWVDETYLRKLPPPADCSFHEMIEQLNKEKETA